jgi:hypothetical protein
VASTVSSWTYVSPNGTPIANPAISSFVPAPANPDSPNSVLAGNANRYNFAETYQIYPAYDYISNFTSIEHEFSDTLKAFATLTYSKNSSYYAFTPVPITFSTEGLVLPATNPYNPFGVALSSLTTRATFIPVAQVRHRLDLLELHRRSAWFLSEPLRLGNGGQQRLQQRFERFAQCDPRHHAPILPERHDQGQRVQSVRSLGSVGHRWPHHGIAEQ